MVAADSALEWWQAFGEGRVDDLWRLSARPVRYMLARAMVAHELNSVSAGGDEAVARQLLVACQSAAVHGPHGPAWAELEPSRQRFFDPVDMEPLIRSMRVFPRTEVAVESYTQITFLPPDNPPMPWIVDVARSTIVGFARVLRGSGDAGELGERLADDPIALWSG